jgi:phosphotransferase system HPr (HPr) family protein
VQPSSELAASVVVTLPADVDLHARPAADFVRAAMQFSSDVWVSAGDREANAKSLLAILALGARRGTVLHLRAEGDDASAAVDTLATAISKLSE